jgi:uncharacterized lipoprotein YehR (DUF1307 family)
MAGAGGYRPGSGAKKNQHRIAAGELRKAIESELGISYAEMLAKTQAKLYVDFKNDTNIKEYLTFTEMMSKRIVEHQVTEVSMTNPLEELSKEDIQARVAKLLAMEKAEAENDAQDNNADNSDQEE